MLRDLLPGIKYGHKVHPSELQGGGNLPFTGNAYWVKLAAGTNYDQFLRDFNFRYPDGTESVQVSITAAQTAATASRGDRVYITEGYTETTTAVKTLSKAGVNYIGLGEGLAKPTLTGNSTADTFSITGANVVLENLNFAAPLTDAQTADVNVAAAGCVLRGLRSLGSVATENKTDIITVASGGDDLLVEGCAAYNTVVDCVSWLSLEAAVARPIIRGCTIQGTFSTAALMDEATATLVTVEHSLFKNIKAATAVLSFSGNSTGVVRFTHVSGRHTTFASNIVPGTGMDFFEVYGTEEAALNGLINPAADAD